jgi:uncharacterized protein YdcH (DUF465 family)
MDPRDVARIEKLSAKNERLRRLWDEHMDFEQRLSAFADKPHLSPEEEMEEKRLKKQKLAGKDAIFEILEQSG